MKKFFVYDVTLACDVIILAVRWCWFWGVNPGISENRFCGIIFVIVIHLASHLDTMKVLLEKTISEIFLKIRPRDATWRHVTSRDHYFRIFALQIADHSKIRHRWGIKMYISVKSILVPFQRGVNHPSTTILRKVVLVWISQICQKMGFSYISPYWSQKNTLVVIKSRKIIRLSWNLDRSQILWK